MVKKKSPKQEKIEKLETFYLRMLLEGKVKPKALKELAKDAGQEHIYKRVIKQYKQLQKEDKAKVNPEAVEQVKPHGELPDTVATRIANRAIDGAGNEMGATVLGTTGQKLGPTYDYISGDLAVTRDEKSLDKAEAKKEAAELKQEALRPKGPKG